VDVDAISDELGIPWEPAEDIPFQDEVPFIGFHWNLHLREVSIPSSKKEKYLDVITLWESQQRHDLEETQKFYGKLLHACLVVPAGRAYLTSLEAFMGVFTHSPFMPRTPPRHSEGDLQWWRERLCYPHLSRPIPGPIPIVDYLAYSDASSEVGIGITIGDRWRAWRLLLG
jgi:hypothetical protein